MTQETKQDKESLKVIQQFCKSLSIWMCNAGGEVDRDGKIIETLIALRDCYYQFESICKKKEDSELIEQFVDDLEEGGIIEEKDTLPFQIQLEIRSKSIKLTQQLMKYIRGDLE
ncbi:MAG: hypothetical protein EZS28_022320 [Streblomastix strix]|uniref:Uncharacterized protein n=1 Tax=Streblomastix strix TaxID=222440 RepID=A0A5J4VIN5_9EUKA|nr:MAG: hypothetical protein EZS28_022320 [Streblomastix strix]